MNYPPFFIGEKLNEALINDTGDNNVAKIAFFLKKNSKLNINQLRKFYDSFVRIYDSTADDKTKKVQLLMLKANVEYSAGRLKIHEFADFFKDRINTVLKQEEKFTEYMRAMKMHFEALVAYFPKN
jgi:CRISPR type III-A-associated protein Csm2